MSQPEEVGEKSPKTDAVLRPPIVGTDVPPPGQWRQPPATAAAEPEPQMEPVQLDVDVDVPRDEDEPLPESEWGEEI